MSGKNMADLGMYFYVISLAIFLQIGAMITSESWDGNSPPRYVSVVSQCKLVSV